VINPHQEVVVRNLSTKATRVSQKSSLSPDHLSIGGACNIGIADKRKILERTTITHCMSNKMAQTPLQHDDALRKNWLLALYEYIDV
jgi:hypothetical protein